MKDTAIGTLVTIGLILVATAFTVYSRRPSITTVPVAASGAPEAAGTYEVHTVPIASLFSGSGASAIQKTIVAWLTANPGKRVVSIIECSDGAECDLVIVALVDKP